MRNASARRHLLAMAYISVVGLVGACGADTGFNSGAPRASAADQTAVEDYLRAAEDALPRVADDQRPALQTGLTRARAALSRYQHLSQEGGYRLQAQSALMVTGVALLADDTTVAGIADDVLLPFVFLGFVAVRLTMDSPAPPSALTESWNEVIDSFTDVAQVAGAGILQAIEKVPPMDQCTEHFGLCLATPLGRRNSGGLWNHSICRDCLDKCDGAGVWPDYTGDDKSCHWWLHVQGLQP